MEIPFPVSIASPSPVMSLSSKPSEHSQPEWVLQAELQVHSKVLSQSFLEYGLTLLQQSREKEGKH